MLAIEFLPARHGDCFLVSWGAPAKVMLVDGGPQRVYETVLRPRLMALPHAQGQAPVVDVLCLTHVDEDHIVGVSKLLQELARAKKDQLPPSINVSRLWFNSVDDLIDGMCPGTAASIQALLQAAPPDAAAAASYGQGREVRNFAATLGLDGNPPFGGPLTTGSATPLHGMEVTVVSPTVAALTELVNEWRAPVKAKDTRAIAAAYVDRKVQNLSSIALHLRHGGRTALLTGDARGDHVVAGLETVGLLAPGGIIHVDVFKLPHHGSENNAAPSLFDRVRADHYVVSADGMKYDHPSKATLEWLVASRACDDTYTIYLTNRIADAEATLDRLRVGRSFNVVVGAPSVTIELPDRP